MNFHPHLEISGPKGLRHGGAGVPKIDGNFFFLILKHFFPFFAALTHHYALSFMTGQAILAKFHHKSSLTRNFFDLSFQYYYFFGLSGTEGYPN